MAKAITRQALGQNSCRLKTIFCCISGLLGVSGGRL